jgi:hypothetical protein
MLNLDWYRCYVTKWQNEITPQSVVHPAKFSRKLIRRIYNFLLEAELLRAGDTVLDPFGGIGLGAADALRHLPPVRLPPRDRLADSRDVYWRITRE